MNDIRALNWRFLVPDEPHGFLFLPVDGEALAGAISPNGEGGLAGAIGQGPYPAVAVPDLAAWIRDVPDESPTRLLDRLADAVAPGGWLYAGFPNRRYPGRRAAPGSIRLGAAVRILRARRFTEVRAFLPFPDQRSQAYFISADTRAPLGHFLSLLVFPYSAGGPGADRKRSRIRWMRRIALASPHPIRVRFAPAAALLARRAA
jgi:hypothetical protein